MFRAQQLHQKLEIEIRAPRENEVLIPVWRLVIRAGIFQEKVFNEAFKLSLRFIRNPNIAANGRFPTAVRDFDYEITTQGRPTAGLLGTKAEEAHFVAPRIRQHVAVSQDRRSVGHRLPSWRSKSGRRLDNVATRSQRP